MSGRLFLAGAGGVVGRHLVPLLLADGWSLTGTTRSPDKAKQLAALGIHPTIVDVFDAAALREAVGTVSIDKAKRLLGSVPRHG
jgi:uncharacterized protein YbjT (DUF2867 family)